MRPFRPFRGVAAPLYEANVNTDAIVPAEFLRAPDADLARGLFARRRFAPDGAEVADFVLNRPAFRAARILIAGPNFGCGSSREAAVWALRRFGIDCVAAPSFADIFHENALRNGLLAARVAETQAAALARDLLADPSAAAIHVDLASQTLTPDGARPIAFEIPPGRKAALSSGEDEIAATLRETQAIDAFAAARARTRPWLDRAMTQGNSP